jgi:hypothetical protein
MVNLNQVAIRKEHTILTTDIAAHADTDHDPGARRYYRLSD